MNERKLEIGDLLENLRRDAAQGLRVGIALGAFGLVHAGSVRFLHLARGDCDRLYAAVLPLGESSEESGKTAALLRPDERLRILAMLEEVDGTVLLKGGDDLEALSRAAPEAVWMFAEAEGDVDPENRSKLSRLGLELRPLSTSEDCTTRLLLERLAR